jgi:hypothetical protein
VGPATLIRNEGSASALGATDWSKWSVSDWMSDIVPRTRFTASLYGLAAAYVFERIGQRDKTS